MVATPARTQNFSSPQKEANTAQPRTISHFGFIDQVGELPIPPYLEPMVSGDGWADS